jgi:hypothetical protein
LNQTIIEAFNRLQVQWHLTVTPRNQRNAITNKHRDYTDDELVDDVRVEEGGGASCLLFARDGHSSFRPRAKFFGIFEDVFR